MATKTQVANEDVEGVEPEEEVTGATTQDAGVPEQGTPENEVVDVESLKAEYEQKLAKASQDLNQLKSSLQSQAAQQEKVYRERQAALEKQLREIRLNSMDGDQRKQYEAELANEEYQKILQDKAEVEQRAKELAATLDAQAFFVQTMGVPANQLVLNQGYDALVNSGYEYLANELKTYRDGTSKPAEPKKPRKQAPEVVTDKASPSKGTDWKDLIAKYGSMESVYRLVESGRLDPSIIPLE